MTLSYDNGKSEHGMKTDQWIYIYVHVYDNNHLEKQAITVNNSKERYVGEGSGEVKERGNDLIILHSGKRKYIIKTYYIG